MFQQPSELAKLAQRCLANSERWFGDSKVFNSVPHMALGLAGKVGKLAGTVERLDRGSISLKDAQTRYELGMDIGDALTFLLNLCAILHIDPQTVLDQKTAENERRFTAERSERAKANQPITIVDGVVIRYAPNC